MGPKSALAAAIASALDEFFVVDKDRIESNLLRDTKIQLVDMQVRKRTLQLPNNNSTVTLSGKVERVVFSWAWSILPSKEHSWVKNAKLEIRGMHITAELSQQENTTSDNTQETPELISLAIQDQVSQHIEEEEVKPQHGGIYGYIQKQVQMIMDSLTLDIQDFKLRIAMPMQDDTTVASIQVGGESIELVSLGRLLSAGDEEEGDDTPLGVLSQKLSFQGFYSRIELGEEIVPIFEPVHFEAKSKRTGERFSAFTENLMVDGAFENDLGIHIGPIQLSVLSRLGVFLLAPPGETEQHDTGAKESFIKDDSNENEANSNASSFRFKIPWCSLDLGNETDLNLANAEFFYVMDSTAMKLTIEWFKLGGEVKAEIKDLRVSLVEPVTLDIGSIETLFLPNMLEFSQPIRNIRISKDIENVAVDLDTIQATILMQQSAASGSETVSTDDAPKPFPTLPLAFIISVANVNLRDEGDGSTMAFDQLKAYYNPGAEKCDVAMTLGAFHHHLVEAEELYFSGSLPTSRGREIDDVKLDVDHIRVTAGKSTNDWTSAFSQATVSEETKMPDSKQSTKKPKAAPWMLPFANVGELKVAISWKGTGMSLDDIKLAIRPYNGKASTSSRDLIRYYSQACLSRVPDFITNAEVLGLNIVDSTASTWGAFLGYTTPFMGPLGGVAAIGAVDAVKGAIEKGKKSRKADEGATTSALDLFRGVVYAVDEANKHGASVRGKSTSRGAAPLNLAIGSLFGTGQYVSENRTRLGAAGLGGLAMVAGALVGGPLGAVVAGVATQAVSGKVLEGAEEHLRSGPNHKKKSLPKLCFPEDP